MRNKYINAKHDNGQGTGLPTSLWYNERVEPTNCPPGICLEAAEAHVAKCRTPSGPEAKESAPDGYGSRHLAYNPWCPDVITTGHPAICLPTSRAR